MLLLFYEISHALGFSNSLLSDFVNPLTGIKLGASNIYKLVNGATFMITPKVLSYARKHFNCPSLTGVPLENEGTSGSLGSHWEKDIFYNEYMTS